LYTAGFSKQCVTPPIGIYMGGHPGNKRAGKILDDLYARALALSDGTATVVFVSVDVLFLHESSVRRIKIACRERLGIPEAHMYLTSTHTHSGPLTSGTFGRDGEADYLRLMEQRIADAVVEAVGRLAPADISTARTRVRDVAFCERIIMKGGRVETHPFKWNEDIIGYESVADDELCALFVQDRSGRMLGAYVNFANHPQVMERENDGLSADFPGRMERLLQEALGADFMMLFGPGACGDICPVDSLNPGNCEIGEAWCERVGHTMAQAVLQIMPGATRLSGPIRSASQSVALTRRRVAPETLERAEAFLRAYEPADRALRVSNYGVEPPGADVISLEDYLATDEWLEQEYKDLLQLDRMCRESLTEDVELNAVVIGDACVVTVPFELFSEIGRTIKEHSPYNRTFVVELTNGAAGYLPTAEAFGRSGSYEVRTLRTSRFVPESEAVVAEAVIELLRSIDC